MANEKRLIYLEDAKEALTGWETDPTDEEIEYVLDQLPTVDAVEVIRCQNCVHAEPLDHNCELSTSYYLHCKLYRGEETKNVWHKYKKYYKDYSLVERDGYCDAGAKMDGGNEDG